MYVVPNSDIMLIRGCPFDLDYENTGYFVSPTAQQNYFQSLNPTILSEYYYQRKDRGYIRVGLPYSQCYNINYMCFKNTSFENKWWYAFVDSVEYINDGVTELHYVIDVIQSWNQVFRLTQCFVERQHSRTDGIGDNYVSEDLDTGEYVFNEYQKLEYGVNQGALIGLSGLMAIIVAVADTNVQAVEGNYQGNVYSGAKLYGFNPFNTALIDTFLSRYIQRPDAIVGMYCVPMSAMPRVLGLEETEPYVIPNQGDSKQYLYSWDAITANAYIDKTYLPKNNKLYTYPFNFVTVNNPDGNGNVYRYEFFDDLEPSFMIYSSLLQPVSVKLFPNNYKNVSHSLVSSDEIHNPVLTNEALTLSGFPMCSWNMDTYKAWCAQQTLPSRVFRDSAHAVLGEMKNSYSANEVQGVPFYKAKEPNLYTSAIEIGSHMEKIPYVGRIFRGMGEEYKASIAADIFKGTVASGNVDVANNNMCFNIGRVSITAQKARIIDDFFTMFGYAQKVVAVPDLYARERWTYVKTIGCHLDGAIPNDDKQLIQNIFDAGIRFWQNPSEIGNYALSNNPRG